ncbi:hypothetical protein LOZ53_006623 [Ophidiomyces ophidiicola]|uniref:Uncharacterized protein n=1 Tax=Ophidiomyces ophidiicola TaxID=1387563 RepID=A0ACB8UQF4_9EURO|nr:uncharacterized protein LOZ57_002402 [Ophidiomyces ophidiicola]KAI1909300.1 hypothetical protein LOZ64_005290 [Ophidiomyces ophidiicola]KAI1910402.1 hypothetical protein LOZ61_004417 [Ophidiomyces ophidiicola]KAI1922475.1 hypothetical protein LOZ60_005699 [Ophidiomyces ophidiicola]KAI1937339.1 hypothetical protein LOZ62_005501 [Ophidiomyces ophidiicola]KAI1949921.1 hypothetical protein LOZ57_002402 [Ophidiomyces ophidiicola]
MERMSFLTRDGHFLRPICSSCFCRIRSTKNSVLQSSNRPQRLQDVSRHFSPQRVFHNTRQSSLHQESQTHQAYPLKGYYSDILSHPTDLSMSNPPLRNTAASSTLPPSSHSPSKQQELSPAERMSIVFGTRLAGPGYTSRYNPDTPPDSTWQTINGVPIPPRPTEPDNCCMSGCVHCVWDDYRDNVEEWAARVQEVKKRRSRAKVLSEESADVRHILRREVNNASSSMDDDGGGSESNWNSDSLSPGSNDLFEGIPVGIREFMKIEKRLRDKKKAFQTAT